MPTMNQSARVTLKSGIKRAIRFDRERHDQGKKAFAVHVMTGPQAGKVMYFHQVNATGPCYFVNRPEARVPKSNGGQAQVYAVTTSALTCHRQPVVNRASVNPAAQVRSAPARSAPARRPYDC